ncbi:methyltransferase domain-containing protein [Sulfurimonas sp. HSL-1716]|uniref:class I SAM-dependent methyltransferase n=1 Tax=Hydrocurvibacter sulfurireducens TaxID=3131937 RepID=UPI0031F731F7
MKLLNLGCGSRYHKEWINLDFKSNNEHVQAFDLHEKLPFEDDSMDVIYSSHVLEHFSKCEAPNFLKECYRVLKPQGIFRVVVPDLEQLMRSYIEFLDKAKKGDIDAGQKYEWIMIELFDQMVRNYGGGEMLEYWKQNPMPQEEFVIQRVGSEVKNVLENIRKGPNSVPNKKCIKKSADEIGKFRTSGEVHQWMYDEYSLGTLLADIGFQKIKRVGFNESDIKDFTTYCLDNEVEGTVRKPDSLFMEAVKQ